ncbi:CASP-like protein 4B1 [Momordica charantia]|uniref:CASP-like protein n=1 Tax=Momordica charantia TaxID=3673 RepID=A0A6J1DT05_MOMCH|nr:CASP-like protein 4B1 [Momordica charantia]
MSNPEDTAPKQENGAVAAATAPPAADVESQTTAATGFGVSEIVSRWRREDLLRRRALALRGCGLILSLLAFVVMACNKHGDWKDFDKYEEFRYLLAIAILSTLYTGVQVSRQVRELSTGTSMFPLRKSAIIDFIGDQILAYLLMSAASSAIPMTNRMREGSDNIFTDSLVASICMSFFAFFSLAFSAAISGYKLSTQSYI